MVCKCIELPYELEDTDSRGGGVLAMMLGKRSGRPAPAPAPARQNMRRTTSMTEFAPPDALAGVPEEELEDEEAELHLLPPAR